MFAIPGSIISGFCSIHFTVTLPGGSHLILLLCYTGEFVINGFVVYVLVY